MNEFKFQIIVQDVTFDGKYTIIIPDFNIVLIHKAKDLDECKLIAINEINDHTDNLKNIDELRLSEEEKSMIISNTLQMSYSLFHIMTVSIEEN